MGTEPPFAEAERVLKGMGLPGTFLVDLHREGDDWSFVVKIHALLEGLSTNLLTTGLNEERLREVFSHLELSDTRSGKVAFMKALGLLEDESRAYISALSELRNLLIHRIENVSFRFGSAANHKISKAVERLLRSTEFQWKPELEFEGITVPRDKFVRENPRLSVWFAAVRLIEAVSPLIPSKDDPNAQLVSALLKAKRRTSN